MYLARLCLDLGW